MVVLSVAYWAALWAQWSVASTVACLVARKDCRMAVPTAVRWAAMKGAQLALMMADMWADWKAFPMVETTVALLAVAKVEPSVVRMVSQWVAQTAAG